MADPLEARPDDRGLVYALCPRCRTPGTKFRPVPGVHIEQKCPRRSCGHFYEVVVWPDLYAIAPAILAALGVDSG